MTWLHVPPGMVPPTSSPSAPGSAGSNLDCNSLSDISARLCEGSVTSKGKLLPSPLWSRRWRRGGFIRLLSGLTLEPSTAQRGVDAWISSLRETRARGTASPESVAANSMTDGCSTAPSTYSRPAGLILSSVRTCRGTRADSSPLPARHWFDWAAALRREYSARPKPATPCGGSDCSSWPSARTSDTNGAGEHGEGGLDLRTAAAQWMAPRKAGGHTINLEDQAEHWPGPAARDWKGSSEGSITRQDGKSRSDMLDYHAEQFFRPPSSPVRPIIAGGSMSSTDGPNSNQPSAKRKLNPIFVEALMRWPTGLSGFERRETAWTRWSQRQRSFLSALFSPPPGQTNRLL